MNFFQNELSEFSSQINLMDSPMFNNVNCIIYSSGTNKNQNTNEGIKSKEIGGIEKTAKLLLQSKELKSKKINININFI